MTRAVPKRKKPKQASDKIKIPFDVATLNSFLKYIRCEFIGEEKLRKLYHLIDALDIDAYAYQTDVYIRIRTLKDILRLNLVEGIHDENLLYHAVTDSFPDAEVILKDIGLKPNQLNSSECDYLTTGIDKLIATMAVFKKRETLIELLTKIDGSSFETSYYSLVEELKRQMGELMGELQQQSIGQGLLQEFSFSDENAARLIDLVVKKRKKPTAILQTGIRQLNALLNPGFAATALYTILGGSGKFKSGTLLNLADQIRKYNPQIIPYENGMRKTILFITLENTIEQSLERIYDMYSDVNDELRMKESADVINTFRNEGQFSFTDTTGIDITFIYRGNLEISTADVYGIVRSLNERGKQPIAIFVDYIKRIDSAHPSMGDERVRMSYVAKELKTIAQFFQIPVITAMQLNRDGNGIIDAAMRDSKQDVARFVGSSSIGNAWDIVEDSDWVALINLERQRSTGKLYLTIKELKKRDKKNILNTVDYFNHPFVNEKNIRLAADVDLDKPLSIISLASDLESIDEAQELQSAQDMRPYAKKVASDSKATKIRETIKAIQLDGLIA